MRSLFVLLALLLTLAPAQAQDAPILQLDTGGHMASIRAVVFSPDGKSLVSAGEDKVIRIWDWRQGKTVRTIRGESGPGPIGKINTIAISPNGKWLAVGGWFERKIQSPCCGDIRIYDYQNGQLVKVLKGHTAVVLGLAFSPDGKLLLSGGSDNNAILWDVETGRPLKNRLGEGGEIYAVAISQDGQLAVTGSYDGFLRIWSLAEGRLRHEIPTGGQIRSISISARDRSIATGTRNGQIRVWNSQTGQLTRNITDDAGYVGSLRFSPDGRSLLATCGFNDCDFAQKIYEADTGRQRLAYDKHDNIVLASDFLQDGSLVATAGSDNHSVHIWDPKSGETKHRLEGSGRTRWAVAFSNDGTQAAWGSTKRAQRGPGEINALGAIETAMRLPTQRQGLAEPEPADPKARWFGPQSVMGPLSLLFAEGGSYGFQTALLGIIQSERPVGIIERTPSEGFRHTSFTFTPDAKAVVSGGGNGHLDAYTLRGQRIGKFNGHEGDVWAVAASPDGRLLLSGSVDQTVRLWNLKTRELVVSIFEGSDGEWVMWTPQGFYTGTAAGARIVGWQINRGPNRAAEYVTAAQLRQHLNRPDIIERALQLASSEAAAREATGARLKIADLLARPVPQLKILEPETGSSVRGGRTQVSIDLAGSSDPVKLIRVHVNGRLVMSRALEGTLPRVGKFSFDVPLASGTNAISVSAENHTGESVSSTTVTHQGQGDLDKPGVLFILAIGVDKYPNLPDKDLLYSGADAKAFVEAMDKRASRLHSKTVKRLLIDGGSSEDVPTAANVRRALEMLREAKENDTIMLFVAGHGLNEGRDYLFAPSDARAGAKTILDPASVVPWKAFADAMTGAYGRRIVFLDTCHSGNSFNRRFLSDGYEANMTFYSSAGADQEAIENPGLGGGHGLFTYVLAEGVSGGARDRSGAVRVDDLQDFLKSRVSAIAATLKHKQVPQYFRARDAENFIIARP